jgi:hypothetical protein
MNKTLIYIKDNIKKTHYIYSNEIDLDYGFQKCYEWLRERYIETYPDKLADIRYSLFNDRCEIFCEEEIINKGWVWNSVDSSKNVLYELTTIPVCIEAETTEIEIETRDIQIMTEPVETIDAQIETIDTQIETIDTQIETDAIEKVETTNCFNVEYITPRNLTNSDVFTIDIPPSPIQEAITQNTQKSYLDNVYNSKSCVNDFFTYYENEFAATSDQSTWYTHEIEPVIFNFSKMNIGNEGYAKNPFSPVPQKSFLNTPTIEYTDKIEYTPPTLSTTSYYDSFVNQEPVNTKDALRIELKNKLTLPNYGLRQRKKFQ